MFGLAMVAAMPVLAFLVIGSTVMMIYFFQRVWIDEIRLFAVNNKVEMDARKI